MEGFSVPNFANFEDAGKFGMNQAGALYGQGPVEQYPGSRVAGFGDYSQNAFSGLQGMGGPNNSFIQGFQNFNNQNPSLSGLQNYQSNNPFMQGFSQFNANNPMLESLANFSAMQNPYLDAMSQQGQSRIADQMNSMFGSAGRGGSGYHAGTTGRALGDFETNLRGGAFDSMMNRNLQAQGLASQGYQNQNAQNLQAMGMGSNAYGQDQGRNLQAQGMAGDLYNTGQAQNLQAQNLGSNAYQNQYNQGLDYNSALQGAGNMQDRMAQLQLSDEVNRFDREQNSGWDNLQNYQNIVAGLNPTQPPQREGSSSFDKLLGLGMMAGGLGFGF